MEKKFPSKRPSDLEILHKLGENKFGIVTIVWTLLSFLGLFFKLCVRSSLYAVLENVLYAMMLSVGKGSQGHIVEVRLQFRDNPDSRVGPRSPTPTSWLAC